VIDWVANRTGPRLYRGVLFACEGFMTIFLKKDFLSPWSGSNLVNF
jgi:hypothetical protein